MAECKYGVHEKLSQHKDKIQGKRENTQRNMKYDKKRRNNKKY